MIDQPDPYPRELIDVWPLRDARQELLEEIVSQPGSEQSPSTRRILVPVGIAVALLLVAGGAWAAISAGGNDKQDEIVAASVDSTAVDPTTSPTSPTTSTDTATTTDKPRHDGVRRNGVRIGRALTLHNLEQCLRVLGRRTGGAEDDIRVRRLEHANGRHYTVYLVRKDHRVIAVDSRCRSFEVGHGRMPRH